MSLKKYRFSKFIERLNKESRQAILVFGADCPLNKAVTFVTNSTRGMKTAPRDQLILRLRTALDRKSTFVLYIESCPDGSDCSLFLDVSSDLDKKTVKTCRNTSELQTCLMPPIVGKSLILTWENDRLQGTAICKDKATDLGMFAINGASQGIEGLKKHFKPEQLDTVFLVAPKEPNNIRASVIRHLKDSKVISQKPGVGLHLWEQPVTNDLKHFSYSDLTEELEAIDHFRKCQELASHSVARGIEGVIDALKVKSVDTLLISDNLAAVRQVYRGISPTHEDLVVMRAAADENDQEIVQDNRRYRRARSSTYVDWLATCDPWEIAYNVVIITDRTPSGTHFRDTDQVAALLRGWRR